MQAEATKPKTMTATEHAAKRQNLADRIRAMLSHADINPNTKTAHKIESAFIVGYLTAQEQAGAAPDALAGCGDERGLACKSASHRFRTSA